MRYAYCRKKLKLRVHILDESGKTFCQVENGSKRQLEVTEEFPAKRLLCINCDLLMRRCNGLDEEFKRIFG